MISDELMTLDMPNGVPTISEMPKWWPEIGAKSWHGPYELMEFTTVMLM